MDVAIISGVGPDEGMGAQLAKRFAKRNLHVFIAGRTQEKLDAVVDATATSQADLLVLYTRVVTEELQPGVSVKLYEKR